LISPYRAAGSIRGQWNRLLGAVVAAFMGSLPLQTSAWGSQGHHLVVEFAESRLSAPARAEVDRLLALEPGATLASVSTWADEIRSPSTAPWHYVNFPRDADCRYEPARSCIDGSCVVAAIERQAAVLASKAPDETRLKALKYVVHFVADAHQPLHGAFADDRGGNSYQLQAYGRGTNLHALWDSGLIQAWPGGSQALHGALESEKALKETGGSPANWAEESCRIVVTEGFYPTGHKLEADYAQRWGRTLELRLAQAGARLAALLNSTLGTR
jgi:hypothetical protein